ncbi:MAG: hypothetical protein A2085_06400 [Gemmatimonadetes bacterium GWC2_71_10]|nr:MAG: hypothetical protein A2085_06400 [Gemmatimonadetes bacterium GWC2_71_10]
MPMICPAPRPTTMDHSRFRWRPCCRIRAAAPSSTSALAPKTPARSAHSRRPMSAFSPVRTKNVPMIEQMMPRAAMPSGSTNPRASKVAAAPSGSTAWAPTPAIPTAASDMVATMELV